MNTISKPTQLKISQRARQDIIDIGRYTSRRWGKVKRDAYLQSIDIGLNTILENPGIGRKCDYVLPKYHRFDIGRHIVFYRISADTIQIVRILHEKQDVKSNI